MTDPWFHLVHVTTVFVTRSAMAFHKLMLPHQTPGPGRMTCRLKTAHLLVEMTGQSVSSVYGIITKIAVKGVRWRPLSAETKQKKKEDRCSGINQD